MDHDDERSVKLWIPAEQYEDLAQRGEVKRVIQDILDHYEWIILDAEARINRMFSNTDIENLKKAKDLCLVCPGIISGITSHKALAEKVANLSTEEAIALWNKIKGLK